MSLRHVRNLPEQASEAAEAPIRKQFRLHQSKIDRARALLGTRTEQETVEMALDLVVFGHAVREGIQALYGSGLINVIDEGDSEPIRN